MFFFFPRVIVLVIPTVVFIGEFHIKNLLYFGGDVNDLFSAQKIGLRLTHIFVCGERQITRCEIL